MFGLPLPLLGLSLIFSIAICVHAVRTHQPMYWLWIVLAFQPLGGIVYLIAILGPELLGGRTARTVGKAAQKALDPGRDYRAAKAAYDDAPTVANAGRLADACAALGRWSEAEGLYREAAQGMYADDPALLLGLARSLVELGRPAEAVTALAPLGPLAQLTAPAQLVLARAYEALGDYGKAAPAYEAAAARISGLEALARYAVFLASVGRRAEAVDLLADIERRTAKARDHFRKEARAWQQFAANGVSAAQSRAA